MFQNSLGDSLSSRSSNELLPHFQMLYLCFSEMSSFTLKLSSFLVSSPSQSSSSLATTSYLPPLLLFRFPRTRFNSRGRVAVVGAAESDKNNSPISGDSKTPNGTLPKTRREILLEYVQNVQPEFMKLFVKRAPQQRPSSENGMVNETGASPFLIAGAIGSCVGSTELRQKAANVIHETCKYLLKEKSDGSILLLLLIRIMDNLGNHGSTEYEEWSNHRQAWKQESTAIIEPPINFIVPSHSKGKRRPRWALIDKVYMHNNTWRSSQSSYHLFCIKGNMFPSEYVTLLMDDLLELSLHSYETVRR